MARENVIRATTRVRSSFKEDADFAMDCLMKRNIDMKRRSAADPETEP